MRLFALLLYAVLTSCYSSTETATENAQLKPDDRDEIFYCEPDKISEGDTIVLHLPEKYPEKLAIVDPEENWFYINDNLPPITSKELKIPSIIEGTVWNEGNPLLKRVFNEKGNYTIYLSDNFDTEIENSFFLKCSVFYQSNR